MDTDLLVAKLLLRGFKHHKDGKGGCKIYQNGNVFVSIRGYRVMVAAGLDSMEKILGATDYALKKANGDRHDP